MGIATLYDVLLTAPWVFLVIFLIWYFFVTDRDTILSIAELFGRPVSSFAGKVVWVTGASSGLGEAIAYELASVGAKLVLTARSKDLLEKVKDECIEISQGKLKKKDILVLSFDITNFDEHQVQVDNAINHFGKVDVLINNAGRYQIGNVIETQNGVERDLFDVNFFGGVYLTKHLLKHFVEKKRGQIIVVSSIAGKYGVPSVAAYAATKYALHGYYESLRMEHQKDHIFVTIVCPGIFKSSIFCRTMSSRRGEIFQKDFNHYECDQMTSERCAHLTLVAAANKLFESWFAYQPLLFMLWGSQYFPDIYKYIMLTRVYTEKRISTLTQGVWPSDLPSWKPLLR